MGLIRQLALGVLAISFVTFVALFGQLQRLRKTPIGYLHRLLRHRLPAFLLLLDHKLTSGTLTPLLQRCGNHLVNEKHPLVLIFYVLLVTTGAYIDPGIITAGNHASAMGMYPFDHTIFFPSPATPPCRSCRLPKPARSKHCSICRACVAKHDHHCVWINNCVGLNNTRHFLFFLSSTNLLLAVGAALSYSILEEVLRRSTGIEPRALHTWELWGRYMAAAVLHEVYVGAVFLLCALCSLLSFSFTAYHLYLVWAGTTTNETGKWADWRDDINDGLIFRADGELDDDTGRACLYRIEAGRTQDLPRGALWTRVEGLHQVVNVYDQGGWKNFWDVFRPQKLQ
ncbi:DHHC palmitoyltransferase-domain-containing protein [Tricharina praecox]|uniref:DHHC palmitoyltransferase-domain-containing protein n=1 Tax=Tricharina praecox TaxID=43433 RepID=UPI0022200F6C|nr:DHHC palmitoyltransferase-domain-containing protein [Tricharina praecox]KAI5849841.1 DHHC palmitoyltransferase-domain-containing protein [Tricharina praecox]